jgi:hypothetical protein
MNFSDDLKITKHGLCHPSLYHHITLALFQQFFDLQALIWSHAYRFIETLPDFFKPSVQSWSLFNNFEADVIFF